ncbi:MAG: PAS domain-containing protein, partial [Proteobacteria bacterium]|nr:PAS domain-containing protein [Pseudomonadota bacterium]
GVVSRQPVFNVALPVWRDGQLRWLLRLALVPEDLRVLLEGQALPARWSALVWDGKGTIMASSRDHAGLVATPAPAGFRGLAAGQVHRVTEAGGQRVLIAVARSAFGPWTTAVVVPAELVDRQLVESLLFWGLCTVAMLGLAIGLAILFGRALTRPLAAVTAAAGALGRGEAFVLPGSSIREVDAVGDALQQARRDLDAGSAALRRSEEQMRTAAEAARFGVHEYDVATDRTLRSPQFLAILGATAADSTATFEGGLDFVHPDDRAATGEAKRAILSGVGEDYQLGYRIVRRDGTVRWVMDRGRVIRDGFGCALRVVGVVLDITDLKEAEQRQRLLFDELSHRVKNTLAIVQALAQQTLRTRPTPDDFAAAFSDRLGALARAHNLLTEHAWRGAALGDLVRGALSAFLDEGRRIDIGGDDVTIPASAAITLGLVMHELATNASKYGALSVPAGQLAVRWTVTASAAGRAIDLCWTESGGPPVTPPSRGGFGSRLLAGSAQQLGGTFEPDYAPAGFRGRLRFTVAMAD